MNTVYFVRHATPDFSVHDDATRPLTAQGISDCVQVTDYFKDKKVSTIYSSPYERVVHTISDIAMFHNLSINVVEDFRERKVSFEWIEDFADFTKKQWNDFSYKLEGGECLNEVQIRNIEALHQVLGAHHNEVIVIGTHGTACTTMLNYYDKSVVSVNPKMPFIVKAVFDKTALISHEMIAL